MSKRKSPRLLLGLIAVVMQTRQSADSNVIGAFTARLQYLLAEAARLGLALSLLAGPLAIALGRFGRR